MSGRPPRALVALRARCDAMPNVVKKDKTTEAPSPQKPAAACLITQQAQEVADLITAQVDGTDVPTRLIRCSVIKEVGKRNLEAALKFAEYQKWAAQGIVVRNSYL